MPAHNGRFMVQGSKMDYFKLMAINLSGDTGTEIGNFFFGSGMNLFYPLMATFNFETSNDYWRHINTSTGALRKLDN